MVKVNCSEFFDRKKFYFSSNLTIFDHTETRIEHARGILVKHENKAMVIGGASTAAVEEMDTSQLSWEENSMSPVNGYNGTRLFGFTALSVDKSLFIFGRLRLLK